jgi:hypothetical protein
MAPAQVPTFVAGAAPLAVGAAILGIQLNGQRTVGNRPLEIPLAGFLLSAGQQARHQNLIHRNIAERRLLGKRQQGPQRLQHFSSGLEALLPVGADQAIQNLGQLLADLNQIPPEQLAGAGIIPDLMGRTTGEGLDGQHPYGVQVAAGLGLAVELFGAPCSQPSQSPSPTEFGRGHG